MLAMAAVVQIAINPKMPKISHPMNRLDHWSNYSQGHWRFISNHRLHQDQRIKTDSFLKEM